MASSIINKKFQYSTTQWVISLCNTNRSSLRVGGHSFLLVEGLQQGTKLHPTPFLGKYDINAMATEESQGTLSNVKGIITKIRSYENEQCDPTRCTGLPGCSYYADPQLAKKMIQAIKQQQREVQEFMQRNKRNFTTEQEVRNYIQRNGYQQHGSGFLWTSIENGDNCTSWCYTQLQVAGIGDGTGKSIPKKGAGQCVIL